MKNYLFILFICLPATHLLARENDDLPERPYPPRLITDLTPTTLDGHEISNLESKLTGLNDTSTYQLSVVIIPTLNGNEIVDYAAQLVKKWRIGQKGKNNGVLLLIAMQDRKTNITVGYELENALTDFECKQILNNILRPVFKRKKYYKGIDKATSELVQAIAGKNNVK